MRWDWGGKHRFRVPRTQPSRPGTPQSAKPVARKRTFRSADRSGRPRRLNRGPSKMRELAYGSRQKLDFPAPQNGGISSRKSRFRALGSLAKHGFPGTSKRRNVFAKLAISSSGKPAKIWISRYIKTGEYVGGASLIRNPGNRPKSAIPGP